MKVFVLILMFTASGRPAGVTHEFTSAESCQNALAEARRAWGSSTYGVCVPK